MTSLEEDFPDFYQSSNQFSIDGQNRYVGGTRRQLAALVLAALAGGLTLRFAVGGADWAGIVAAVAFAGAALQRGYLWRDRPEKDWYAGRAAAESAKTLSWRFVAGAEPFLPALDADEAAKIFLSRLGDIRAKVSGLVVVPPPHAKGEITAAMRRLRASPFEERRAAYLEGRLEDQRGWYARNARFNRRRVRVWTAIMLALEVVGLGGAILKAAGVLDVDALGFASALVAALAAWSEMRQYSTLASAYSVTANELSDVLELGRLINREQDWSQFVVDGEEAISREHTMWVASRDR